ncbi:hypothetical protein [Photobacterium proteolyticum]|nr:hypothetical protein [Photobacterium proteolyticum]
MLDNAVANCDDLQTESTRSADYPSGRFSVAPMLDWTDFAAIRGLSDT